jgi:hypothetical protein
MTFRNPILGGNGQLIRQNIHSENYVPGVAGWQITRDGDAEFNNVTTRGELFVGDSNQYMRAYVAPAPISGPALTFNDDAAHLTDGYIRAVPGGANGINSSITISSPYAAGESPSQLTLTSGNPRTANLFADLTLNGALSVEPAVGNPVFAADDVNGARVTAPFFIQGNRLDAGWIPFTPVWTASVTNPSLGNGTRNSRYKMIADKTMMFRIRYQFGTTTNFGSGAYGFTLPFAPSSLGEQTCAAFFNDDSATQRIPGTAWINNTSGIFRVLYPGGSVGAANNQPFIWAANDLLVISGIVELD